MEQLKQFLLDIHVPDTLIQYGELYNVGFVSSSKGLFEYMEANKNKDLYFLANVDKQTPMRSKTKESKDKTPEFNRAADVDMIKKGYVYFDFDVYNIYKEKGEILTPNQIKEISRDSVKKLDDVGLGDWSYLVFSGGGFHVYFVGEPTEINLEHYSQGYVEMANVMADAFGFEYDKSCRNVARIARLPYSYNNKKRYDEPVLVEILERRENKSEMIKTIQEIGSNCVKEEKNERANEDMKREKLGFKDNRVYDSIIQLSIKQEVLKFFTSWKESGKYNFRTPSGNLSAAFISDKYPETLICDQSREFKHLNVNSLSTFTFVKNMYGYSDKDTFQYFEDNYHQINILADQDRKEWSKDQPKSKTQIGLVSWSDMLEEGEKETEIVKPEDIFSYGYDFLDNELGGIFEEELILIGGITNTGKTTLALKIAEKMALKGKKCVVAALEERLSTRARKAILYEVNRKRKAADKIRMIDFLTGKNKPTQAERRLAIDNLKNDNLKYVSCDDKLDTGDLEEIYKQGADLYVLDHLHYFSLTNSNDSKADKIETAMQEIKRLTKKYNTRTILIAHFQKIDESKRPTMTNFKDSISIAQTANTVIMLWRDKSESEDYQIQYETEFIVPKNRVDEPAVTIKATFDVSTNEYIEKKDINYGTKNSDREQNELFKYAQKTF